MQQEQIVTKILQMKEFLIGQGIPYGEAERAAFAYYNEVEPPIAREWPNPVTGLDLLPQITLQVPDTGSPPYFQPNTLGTTQPYPTIPTPDPLGAVKTNNPTYSLEGSNIGRTYQLENPPYQGDDTNWVAIGNKPESQPPTIGMVPWNVQQDVQPWKYPIEDSQMIPDLPPIAIYPSGQFNETEPEYMEYVYQNHDNNDVCNQFKGKIFDMKDRSHRPVPPSEGLGYTNTHPNCKCYWKPSGDMEADAISPTGLLDIQTIHRKIGQRSHNGTLHKVKKEGDLSQRTGYRNYYRKPLKMIQEAIAEVRHEFGWLSEDYLMRAKEMAQVQNGVLYLIRASQEAITDHRAEGEPYRRLLAASELLAMSRTAIGHGMDINHNPEWRTGATILDSEFDPNTKSIQMLIMETDPQINQMISQGQIDAVSINGGSPRTEAIEPCNANCTHESCEKCVVPRGVILGELDDIGLTWVVSDPRGVVWRGNHIPRAEPGVKTTIIQPIQ
jgi:hypothetical protein